MALLSNIITPSNVLTDSDLGSTVQAYDADTAKLDAAQTFTANQTINANLIVDTNTLYVDSANDRVGINDSSPSYTLDVTGNGARFKASTNTNNTHSFVLSSGSDFAQHLFSGNNGAADKFVIGYGDTHPTTPNMLALKANNVTNGTIGFYTNNGAERMRIDTSGKVGIGTSSPNSILHVEGTTTGTGTEPDAIAYFKQNGTWSASQPWALYVEGYSYLNGFRINGSEAARALYKTTAGGQLGFAVAGDDPITFTQSDSTERMRIATGGNVGIGTSSPSSLLHLKSTGSAILTLEADSDNVTETDNARIELSQDGGAVTGRIGYASNTNTIELWNNASENLIFGTANAEIMRITSSGNVGIGTSSPAQKLDIASKVQIDTGNSFGRIRIARTTDSNVNLLYIQGADIAGTGNILTLVNAGGESSALEVGNGFRFYANTSTTERMRITSSGNVGIGTTSPSYKLEVNGSFAATTKSFVIDHPTKPDMKLRYGSLEGPENGVYVRGKLKASGKIYLPDYWVKLVHEDSITVNLTPIGSHQKLYVKEIKDNIVIVEGLTEDGRPLLNIECYYTVFAERKDVDKLEVEF